MAKKPEDAKATISTKPPSVPRLVSQQCTSPSPEGGSHHSSGAPSPNSDSDHLTPPSSSHHQPHPPSSIPPSRPPPPIPPFARSNATAHLEPHSFSEGGAAMLKKAQSLLEDIDHRDRSLSEAFTRLYTNYQRNHDHITSSIAEARKDSEVLDAKLQQTAGSLRNEFVTIVKAFEQQINRQSLEIQRLEKASKEEVAKAKEGAFNAVSTVCAQLSRYEGKFEEKLLLNQREVEAKLLIIYTKLEGLEQRLALNSEQEIKSEGAISFPLSEPIRAAAAIAGDHNTSDLHYTSPHAQDCLGCVTF